MRVQTIIRKGKDHPVFCEDFLAIENHGRYFIGAVFDGCSGGNESHFASSLLGKIFKQVLNEEPLSGDSIEDKAKDFVKKLVQKLFDIKTILELQDNDLLSTLIMLMYDKVHGEALVISVGDGIIHCDGKYTVLENKRFKSTHPDIYKNMPDYIAYDIVELGLDRSYFDIWFDNHIVLTKYIDPKDISISTDGIFTFSTPSEEVDTIYFLMEDDKWIGHKIMLSKKVNILRTKYKSVHRDDLSIIRLIPKFEENDKCSN